MVNGQRAALAFAMKIVPAASEPGKFIYVFSGPPFTSVAAFNQYDLSETVLAVIFDAQSTTSI